jgi:hypothetical protein
MPRLSFLSVWFVLALTAVPGWAQDKVELKWRFKEDEEFTLENVEAVSRTVTFMGQSVHEETEKTTRTRFKVLKANPTSLSLEVTIESVQLKGDQKAEANKWLEQLKGATFRATLDAAHRITKFEGYQELLHKLSAGDEENARLLGTYLNEDAFRAALLENLAFLPAHPVAQGEKWKREKKLSFGPLGGFKGDTEYVYLGKGKNDQEEMIGFRSTLAYTAPAEGEGGLPFRIANGDLAAEKASGTLVFDSVRSRLLHGEHHLLVKGTLNLDVMGTSVAMTLEQTATTTMRLLDGKPGE